MILVVTKNPSDFTGAHIGESEEKTKKILESSVGKVLIIDEAYSFYGGGGQGGNANIFKIAAIDTIVAEVQSVAGDNQCVLLLGYRDEMEAMFQNMNPGLSRRFPLASAFEFEDFDKEDLRKILQLKLKVQAFKMTSRAYEAAADVLERARNRPHFGNAGEIDILLDRAKARQQTRISANPSADPYMLEAEDLDKDFDRGTDIMRNCRELFKDVIGCDAVVSKLEHYQQITQRMRERQLDPREAIPFNFLFRGPPGQTYCVHTANTMLITDSNL